MIYREGQELVVNHSRKGQFLGIVVKEFNTETDEWATLRRMGEGGEVTVRISFCKFKLSEVKI